MSQNNQDPEFIDPNKSNEEVSDSELAASQGGSFLSGLTDALMLPVRPFKAAIDYFDGDQEKQDKIREKTGQEGFWNKAKWIFAPNSMEEQTKDGIQKSIDQKAVDQVLLSDEFKKK